MAHALGRREPTDWAHVAAYPLRAVIRQLEPTIPMPVVFGVNWYTAFDSPQKRSDGYYWLPEPSAGWGTIRGGHAICAKPPPWVDYTTWWDFYNQGAEGACVGFALSRMMTLKNRARYDARWLYKRAQETDEWPGTDYSGTSVRAGCRILVNEGHKTPRWTEPRLAQGIAEYRWATTVEEIAKVLGLPAGREYLPLLNSWGRSWPHVCRASFDTVTRLLSEGGECVAVVDR